MKKIAVLLLLLSIFLTSCGNVAPKKTEIFAMDTFMQLQVWGDETLLSEATARIYELESAFSVTRENSELFLLNQKGRGALSAHGTSLLSQAIVLSERSEGAFDPTVYPFVRAWGFTEQTQGVPSSKTLDALFPFVGTEHVHANENTVTLDEGTMLDFGGIAKGYAAQSCAELLQDAQAALLVLGGNIQTVGTKPDGSDWNIGIADPKNSSQAIAKLRFQGSMAVVTSGGYERFFEENGKQYHHILDPKTGYPVQNELASVTVLAQNGVLADAFSTALFVMGLEKASEFWRASDDFEVVFILNDGSIFATEGAASLLYDCEFTVIER